MPDMKASAVLAAAAALHEFTLGQVAAYCDGDLREMEGVIDSFSRFFTVVDRAADARQGDARQERRWRVVDAAGLRAAIAQDSPAQDSPAQDSPPTSRATALSSRRAVAARSLEARLVLAEETLVDCGAEPSAVDRRVMATTVMNYLRQVLAMLDPGRADWWEIEAYGPPATSVRLPDDDAAVSRSRLLTDVALARMTACEAAGETLAIDYLIEAGRLFASDEVDRPRRSRLFERFANLARELTAPSAPRPTTGVSMEAPARLLFAVAWGRACVRFDGDGSTAAQDLVNLLKGFARSPFCTAEGTPVPLYQVLGRLPHGRRRVMVYTDLLDLLPRYFEVALTDQIVPGALAEAVAGDAASNHLREWAAVIETDLACSPFRSDSALIGQVAHVFQDLAVKEAGLDRSVVERADRTRAELLSLAGVPV